MTFLDRVKRFRRTAPQEQVDVLPDINQRVTVVAKGHDPVHTRVDDEGEQVIVLSSPSIPLEVGERVSLSWEGETCWYRFESTIEEVQIIASRPTVTVSKFGQLSSHSEQRGGSRQDLRLPMELRVVTGRVVNPGTVLSVETNELSRSAVQFETTALLNPGDILEARLRLDTTAPDTVPVRLKVVRMDTIPGTWSGLCSAVFDDILRSDRLRIAHTLDTLADTQQAAIDQVS